MIWVTKSSTRGNTIISQIMFDYFHVLGSYGLPRPWYFPLQPSYWCGITVCRSNEEEDLKNNNDKGLFKSLYQDILSFI